MSEANFYFKNVKGEGKTENSVQAATVFSPNQVSTAATRQLTTIYAAKRDKISN